MKEKNSPAPFLSQRYPWDDNNNVIWLASTLKFYRNVSKYLFPTKLDSNREKQLLAILSKPFSTLPLSQPVIFLKADEMTPVEKDFLYEHFIATEGFQEAHTGEGFVIDQSGEFLAVFNIRDHLQLQYTDCKGELEQTWNRLVKLETAIGKSIDYSFSPRFGFLTAEPSHCGTGFSAHLYLHLPALVHMEKLFETLDRHSEEGITATSMQGDLDEIIGDIVTLQNNYALGLPEEAIISSLRTAMTRLVAEEKALRSQIKEEAPPALKNKVSRAYALCCHSYQLEVVETLNALSLCKLAIDLGWISGVDHKILNELIFTCRRAHLIGGGDDKINHEELSHKRASTVHQALKPASLLI